MKTVSTRGLSLLVAAALAVQSLGCGSIMYPYRRGAQSGRIDPGVAVLDGVGLLFFIIPGVIAFAVDFSDGAIYLPDRHWHHDPDYGAVRMIRFDKNGDERAEIEAVVRAQTGRDVDLEGVGVRRIALTSVDELPARFAAAQARD